MGVTLEFSGSFDKTRSKLTRLKRLRFRSILDKYGRMGVELLSKNTPVDSGETASSWYYEIESSKSGFTITWCNSHTNRGVNVALILQLGHATRSGSYVQGIDYINPAVRVAFEKMGSELLAEVKRG